MKKYIKHTLAAIAAAAILTGCASLPPSTSQTAVTSAAALGTAYDLSVHPADLAYFQAAEAELYTIAASTNTVTATNIDAVLAQAGITNPLESVGLTTAVNIANGLLVSNTANSTNTTVATIKDVCGWIADGISESAAEPLASLKAKAKAPHKE